MAMAMAKTTPSGNVAEAKPPTKAASHQAPRSTRVTTMRISRMKRASL
jgi:hypothetical protein